MLFGDAYAGRRVFLTGHTGFKGGWLAQWLRLLGAEVTGYALAPPSCPSFFDLTQVAAASTDIRGDVRDGSALAAAIAACRPHVIFHLAAQPLVRRSYVAPVETVETNIMGTMNLLEAVRSYGESCAVVVVTSDKCYRNAGAVWGYRENDPLGGADPYSMSKAATELICESWRRSFFDSGRVRLATARAGNVIGGGDWAVDRIMTDCVNSLVNGAPVHLRNPRATRPWQHVLEPLSGYLWLGARLLSESRGELCDAWNFGPHSTSVCDVETLVRRVIAQWGAGSVTLESHPNGPHEATLLSLSSDKAIHKLGWRPVWGVDQAVRKTVEWYRAWQSSADLKVLSETQIASYVADARADGVSWSQ